MSRKDYYNSEKEKVLRAATEQAYTEQEEDAQKEWGNTLNKLASESSYSERSPRYFYLNPCQLLVYNFGARHTTIESGRGTGKTDGMIAPFMIRTTESMPGGSGIFLGNSIKQLYSRTIPAVLVALERNGYKEGIHFFRGRAPKKCNFREPYVRPQRWDNVLHFYNGFVWYLISTAVIGSANGMSVFAIIADEAKFISEAKYNGEVLPALRGSSIKTDNPGFNDNLNPFCKSTFLVSDAPLTPRQAWLYKQKKNDTDEVNEQIAEMLAELSLCPEIAESEKFIKKLNNLRCQSSAYFRFSTIENVDILKESFIKQMKKSLSPMMFDISIRNVENSVSKDGYYFNLNVEEVHGYRNSDDMQLQAAQKFNKRFVNRTINGGRVVTVETEAVDLYAASRAKNCIFDTDIIPGDPLRIAFDYNASVNAMVIGQTPSRGKVDMLKVLNSMIVQNNRKLEALCGDFCRYYEPHKGSCNDVIFYYDSTAKQGGSYASSDADKTRFYNIVKSILKKHGWNVIEVYMGRTMGHNQKFEFINGALSGLQRPMLRFNIENNQFLLQSMELTMVKQTAKGFMKYKDAEKLKNMQNSLDGTPSQSGITDITDALDTLIIGVRYYNVGRLRAVGLPILG